MIILMLQTISFLIYHNYYSIKKGDQRGGEMRREGERGKFCPKYKIQNAHRQQQNDYSENIMITCDFRVLQTLKSFTRAIEFTEHLLH